MNREKDLNYSPSLKRIGKDFCCGCGACYAICPSKAIVMSPDIEGFLYPNVNSQVCTSCGECVKVCPIVDDGRTLFEKSINKCYIGYSNSKKDVLESSSGGVFGALAKVFIGQNGVVAGVVWNEEYDGAYYKIAHSMDEVGKMRKSKYVQSDKRDIFEEVKVHLEHGEKVLFSGCGCDIAALKKYLRGKDDLLFTIELICHGPTSSYLLKEWNEYLKRKYKSDIVDLDMRSKKDGENVIPFHMKIEFSNGKIYRRHFFDTQFGYAFSSVQRISCYNCKFKGKDSHVGDITVGDVYGTLKENKEYNSLGTSVIVVNNSKGEELLGLLDDFYYKHVEYDEVYECIPMLTSSWTLEKKRFAFSELWLKYGLIKAAGLSKGRIKRLKFFLPDKVLDCYYAGKNKVNNIMK